MTFPASDPGQFTVNYITENTEKFEPISFQASTGNFNTPAAEPNGSVSPQVGTAPAFDFTSSSSMLDSITPEQRNALLPTLLNYSLSREAEERARRDQRSDAQWYMDQNNALITRQNESQKEAALAMNPWNFKNNQLKAIGQIASRASNFTVTQVPVAIAPLAGVLRSVAPINFSA